MIDRAPTRRDLASSYGEERLESLHRPGLRAWRRRAAMVRYLGLDAHRETCVAAG
jgi:hypothetical protein